MPRNRIGGKKGKRSANKPVEPKYRIDCKSDDDEIYGRVTKKLGSGRFNVVCTDKIERNCRVAGRLYRKTWINQIGTIVLVSIHSDLASTSGVGREDRKGSIVAVYKETDVSNLIHLNEITREFSIGVEEVTEDMVVFGDDYDLDDI